MKKHIKKPILYILVGLTLCLISGVAITQNLRISIPLASTSHAPFTIRGDTELDAFCAGDGTDGLSWETAHVIENLEITGGGTETALGIEDTTRYLIIRSCTLENSQDYMGCLDIANCTNINVTDCIMKNNDYEGIIIIRSTNILIKNNEIFETSKGIQFYGEMYESTDIIVTQNEIHDVSGSGIVAVNLDNSEISYNTIKNTPGYGISLESPCENNELICNSFKNTGFGDIKDEGTSNTITDTGCPGISIPFYVWIIVGVAGATVLTTVIVIVVKKKRK